MAVEIKLPTIEDYMAFGDKPIEVIDGEFVEMSPHGRKQPHVMRRLNRNLDPFVTERNLGAVLGETSYVLDGNRRKNWVKNARTPDGSFISQNRIDAHDSQYPNEYEPYWLAPEIAIEVISPTDENQDVARRLRDYLTYGVLIVWFIYPKTKTVMVYTQENPMGVILEAKDLLTADPVIIGWSMPVAKLFEE